MRFSKTAFLPIIFMVVSLATAHAHVRGLWVVRYTLTSPANVRKVADAARKAGVTDLFVQFYARGEAYFQSSAIPTASCVTKKFDPLALMVKECKARGIRMHAWINLYYVWSSDGKPRDRRHAYYRGREWFGEDPEGRITRDMSQAELSKNRMEGVFLSPANPEVKHYLRELVREILLKYDVDGIHLDYVRYGNMDFGYDYYNRMGFLNQYRIDPYRFLAGDPALRPYWDTWFLWRMYHITDLVAQLRRDIAQFNPWVQLSAAVRADPDEARTWFGQDWPGWLANRWIDFVVLMNYSKDTRTVVRLAKKSYQYRGQGEVYVGIGAWRDSPAGIRDKISGLRQAGIDDIVLYSYDGLAERGIDFESLRNLGF